MDINGWNVELFLCIMRLKGDSILPFNPVGQIKLDPDSKPFITQIQNGKPNMKHLMIRIGRYRRYLLADSETA